MKKKILIIAIVILGVINTFHANAISFNLDSISQWGKFPKFCVDVYRWGDRFFNPYDHDYVTGTGYKFNVKTTADSWLDFYHFDLPEDRSMSMVSRPSTSLGLYLTYMAVSVGYDVNFSKIFHGPDRARRRFSLGFNCSLLSFDYNYISNDVGTNIKRFETNGQSYKMDIPFHGINNNQWTMEVYYFFNHKKYSQAAAFNFSKVQKISQGSFYAGLYFSGQKYNFDFNELPIQIQEALPPSWINHIYTVDSKVYAARLGYGYNWVFAPHWVLGVSESPILGLRVGDINTAGDKNKSFALNNSLRLGIVWNNGHWFTGLVGDMQLGLVYDKLHTMVSTFVSVRASVGYRFNLW